MGLIKIKICFALLGVSKWPRKKLKYRHLDILTPMCLNHIKKEFSIEKPFTLIFKASARLEFFSNFFNII
jgi:hypothetical protein